MNEADTIEAVAEQLTQSGGDATSRFDRAEAMVANLLPVEYQTTHRFAGGIYARELTIPAGAMLTGKIHKTEHLNIISKGDITVFSADEGTRRIKAPFAFVSKPGARRIGYAHEETVWTCIHATTETDLDKLEALLIESHDNPLLKTNPETLSMEDSTWHG